MKLHKLNLIIKRFTASSQYLLNPLKHNINILIPTPYIAIDIPFARAQFAEGVCNLIKYKSLFSSYFLIKRPLLPLLAPACLTCFFCFSCLDSYFYFLLIFYRIFVYLLPCTLRVFFITKNQRRDKGNCSKINFKDLHMITRGIYLDA